MRGYDWVHQLDALIRELEALGGGRRLVAVTLSVPPHAPLDVADRLLTDALDRAGYPAVQVTVRPGTGLQVVAAEFARRAASSDGER